MKTPPKKELGYLKGCTLCNEGSANEVDQLVESGLSKKAAYDRIADDVESSIGYRLFSPASIKKRYLVQTGKSANNGIPAPAPIVEEPPKDLKEPSQSATSDDVDLDTVSRKQYNLKTKSVLNLELQLKAKDDEMADRISRKLDEHTIDLQADLDNARTALKHLQDHPQTKTVTEPAPEPELVEVLPENTVTKEKYNKLGDSLADLQANYEALQAQLKIQEQTALELDALNSMQEANDDQTDYERGFTAGFAEAMNTFNPQDDIPMNTESN